MGSLNLVSTTTEQTGRPRETNHPSQIKHNVFYKSLSPLNIATHIWQQVTEHILLCQNIWFLLFLSQAMPKEWEENTIQLARTAGHMVSPTSSLILPCLFSQTAIKMSRKLITPTAREIICYSKYREV